MTRQRFLCWASECDPSDPDYVFDYDGFSAESIAKTFADEINPDTQHPFTQKVKVKECSTGIIREFEVISEPALIYHTKEIKNDP